MPAHIHREAMTPRKMRNDPIPTPRMESSGMAKEDRRILARPLEQRNLDTMDDGDSALDGHPIQSSRECSLSILLLIFGLERNNDAARNAYIFEPDLKLRSTAFLG
jgi:hypothetical protein